MSDIAVQYAADAVFVIGIMWFIAQWRLTNTRRDECAAWERIEMARISDDKQKADTSAIGFHSGFDDEEESES